MMLFESAAMIKMRKIKRKLKNKDGASVLIALVGFMAAAMVSVVIVSAAVSSARNVSGEVAVTQESLTLQSAVELIETEMENTEYTRTVYSFSNKPEPELVDQLEQTELADTQNIKKAYTYSQADGTIQRISAYRTNEEGFFGEEVLSAMPKIDGELSEGETSGEFSVSAEELGLDQVDVTYEMEASYVIFHLTESSSGEALCLTMQRYEPVGVSSEEFETELTESGTDENGEACTYYETDALYTKTVYTYSWKLISIEAE